MGLQPRAGVTYLPKRCRFLDQDVWAILIEQPDHTWQIANCLDKHEVCYKQCCTFTVSGGEWPFEGGKSGPIDQGTNDQPR